MAPVERIKVMVVDDHAIMLDGLCEILERSGGFEVVGQARDGATAVKVARKLRPDVIIMDVMMPVKSGIDASREITEMLPETRVVILTASTEHDAVIEAVAAGASGYLHKYSGKDRLFSTVRDVADGEYRLPADIIRRVFTQVRMAEKCEETRGLDLTTREREILALFARGMSYAQIAQVRGNKPLTIRNAIYGIQDKLGIETKQGLVVWAVRSGLLDDQGNGLAHTEGPN